MLRQTVFTILALTALIRPVFAEQAQASLLWQEMISAMTEFENSTTETILSSCPDYKDVYETSRNLQLTSLNVRTRQFHYLLKNKPNKIVLDKGIKYFLNFIWSEKEENTLLEKDQAYHQMVSALESNALKMKDFPELEKAKNCAGKVYRGEEFKKATDKINGKLADIGERLKFAAPSPKK